MWLEFSLWLYFRLTSWSGDAWRLARRLAGAEDDS